MRINRRNGGNITGGNEAGTLYWIKKQPSAYSGGREAFMTNPCAYGVR